ncbi:GLPGLI family protein [Polaribacter septentrionalilitoris]|uniref:GLPGLI family protein n=1 Tax=Polaribacter septentrionalilitoris TaxID=2494657 RepID=UPI00135CC00B|nr:GLPGLI family protein [Polaribacter septentrionalilitoris]
MKTLLTTFAFLMVVSLNAQKFQGKAVYKTSRKSNVKFGNDKNSKMSDEMKQQLQARLQKMNQKTYILDFDKYESVYKQDVALGAPRTKVGGAQIKMISLGGGSSTVLYKNIKEKRYAKQTEIQGKRFLIKDEINKQDWVMSSETKNIGKYTCYKATYTKEVESKKATFVDGKSEIKTTKENVTTTAWYTPEIPLSNGPDNYQGLPGLILEINDGKNTIVCTEIIINPSEKIVIEEPKKGKVVNQKKFNKIQEEKSNELMEKFKSRNGMDLGNGINIKMGG